MFDVDASAGLKPVSSPGDSQAADDTGSVWTCDFLMHLRVLIWRLGIQFGNLMDRLYTTGLIVVIFLAFTVRIAVNDPHA